LSGGKVSIRFIKSNANNISINDTTGNLNNMSSYFVGSFISSTANQIGYTLGSTTQRFYFPYTASGTTVLAGYGSSASAITLETTFNTNRKLYELLAPSPLNSAVVQGWTNGVAKNTFALVSVSTSAITLGTAAANYFDGYIQEVIGWQSNANRLEKETNINDYWTIY